MKLEVPSRPLIQVCCFSYVTHCPPAPLCSCLQPSCASWLYLLLRNTSTMTRAPARLTWATPHCLYKYKRRRWQGGWSCDLQEAHKVFNTYLGDKRNEEEASTRTKQTTSRYPTRTRTNELHTPGISARNRSTKSSIIIREYDPANNFHCLKNSNTRSQ